MDSKKRLFREKIFQKVVDVYNLTMERDLLVEFISIPIKVSSGDESRIYVLRKILKTMPNTIGLEFIVNNALDEYLTMWKDDKSMSMIKVNIITRIGTDKIAETPMIDLEKLKIVGR
ncbi:MAG: hypothetical protein GYB35_15025 [Algicola sp.]|nr:hypothetical protein [Algicola sp.]